jgi:CRISPR-associated protein Csd2
MSDEQKQSIPRATGMLVIDVCNSNPNGDPDRESDPRQRSFDGRGYISGVSFKRKLRDLVLWKDGRVWQAISSEMGLEGNDFEFDILESRGRNRDSIKRLKRNEFQKRFWDARVFGNTFLESIKQEEKVKPEDVEHFIRTGVAQFGLAISVSPVRIERWTKTNKAGVQEGKDRGMAPLGDRRVIHGLYCMPYFINNTASMEKTGTGCQLVDIALLLRLIRYAYPHTKSEIRPFVEVRHAWYAEHKDDLGSFSEFEFFRAMTPIRKGNPEQPSIDNLPLTGDNGQYDIPTNLPETFGGELKHNRLYDLCLELPEWCGQFKGKGGNG